jgi:DNA invertase Pin-like site-specific DNA recombinase
VGVYADEAKTGTKDSREQFQQLLTDCKAGKIDHILTKSISRMARNTVTLLETVRELKTMGITVYFEEQNIDTGTDDGELMLSILASYAQEESLSASENQKWRVRQNFQSGRPWNTTMLGYRHEGGGLVIHPQEAELVKQIFDLYLQGKGLEAIVKEMNATGHTSRYGNEWTRSSISRILQNYSYTGNLLLQTTYRKDHLTKRKQQNNGELPKYHITDAHEAIIPLWQFNAAQEEMQRRAEKHTPKFTPKYTYPLAGKIICAKCGKLYRRKVKESGPVWICSTYNTQGKAACPSKAIPEPILEAITDEVGGIGKITALQACDDNTLVLTLTNEEQIVKRWQDRSRRQSWTPEMREAARRRKLRKEVAPC